ncbi:hypothetical protein, partial [Metallibacterium sp.]|uniref:hypothetical protein n=1 Tax=Metallibacterium sp. TaxID=2940281 RepID=UPI0026231C6A
MSGPAFLNVRKPARKQLRGVATLKLSRRPTAQQLGGRLERLVRNHFFAGNNIGIVNLMREFDEVDASL